MFVSCTNENYSCCYLNYYELIKYDITIDGVDYNITDDYLISDIVTNELKMFDSKTELENFVIEETSNNKIITTNSYFYFGEEKLIKYYATKKTNEYYENQEKTVFDENRKYLFVISKDVTINDSIDATINIYMRLLQSVRLDGNN